MNITQAIKKLGIPKMTFYRHIKEGRIKVKDGEVTNQEFDRIRQLQTNKPIKKLHGELSKGRISIGELTAFLKANFKLTKTIYGKQALEAEHLPRAIELIKAYVTPPGHLDLNQLSEKHNVTYQTALDWVTSGQVEATKRGRYLYVKEDTPRPSNFQDSYTISSQAKALMKYANHPLLQTTPEKRAMQASLRRLFTTTQAGLAAIEAYRSGKSIHEVLGLNAKQKAKLEQSLEKYQNKKSQRHN